jgi:hypothetical protein
MKKDKGSAKAGNPKPPIQRIEFDFEDLIAAAIAAVTSKRPRRFRAKPKPRS